MFSLDIYSDNKIRLTHNGILYSLLGTSYFKDFKDFMNLASLPGVLRSYYGYCTELNIEIPHERKENITTFLNFEELCFKQFPEYML